MKLAVFHPVFLLIPALWIIWGFGIQTLGGRLWIEVNGTITDSRDLPATHAPRYITRYTVQEAGARNTVYVAGPSDASLPRSMPAGTKIAKHRWRLSYDKNGQTIDDFPTGFYSGTLGIALALMLWSFLRWQRRMRRIVSIAP